jgi:hypothetical protein
MEKFATGKRIVCSSCGQEEIFESWNKEEELKLIELGWKIMESVNYFLCPICNR